MGILSKLLQENRSVPASNTRQPRRWLTSMLGLPTHSGANVTPETAVNQSVVWRAITLLSGQIASLPLNVYERLEPRGKEKARDHPLYQLIHDRPNPFQTSFEWRNMGIAHQLIWGNWYSLIEREGTTPVALWPLPPWKTNPFRDKRNDLWYDVYLPDGTYRRVPYYDIIHVKNLFTKGDKGLGCVEAAKEAVGLGLAAEEFGARFFGQGTNVGGIVEHPGELGDSAFDRLREQIQEKYEGLGRSHKLMLLEEGMKYHQIGIPPDQAQFLETRKFQVAELGRFFFISQLHKLGDLERATFSNIEHQAIEFVVDTLRPLLVNIEQQINQKLFQIPGQDDYFVEFVVDGLLRGDVQSRYTAYATGRQWGWLSANDIRELENQNPLPDEQGDVYLSPMNMVPAEKLLDPEVMRKYHPEEVEQRQEPQQKKEKRGAAARNRFNIEKNYQQVFRDTAQRIIRREQNDVKQKAKKLLNNRGRDAFEDWLEEFYREKHPEFVENNMAAPVSALSDSITDSVEEEMDREVNNKEALERFKTEYLKAFSARYTGMNLNNIRKAIRQAVEEGEEIEGAVEAELDRWDDFRAEDVARNETVQLGGAVSRVALAGAGASQLRWVNTGSETCEFCEQLDGKVVAIEQPFLPEGEEIQNSDGSMRVKGPKMHPPIHRGCVCTIEAG